MIQNYFSPKVDKDAETKRALAKVYRLLLRIAEEREAAKAKQSEEKSPSRVCPTNRTTEETPGNS
jgi:hypothetical protein